MTQAHHRAPTPAITEAPAVRVSKGVSAKGIWWVAWRQHRLQIAVLLAIIAAGAAALAVLRARIITVFHEFGCPLYGNLSGLGCVDTDGMQVWWSHGFSTWSQLAHVAMIGGPIVLGVFAAAPIFTREFSHGTQVFALTQSVGRGRWFAAKLTVLVVPLVGGLLVLGFLMQWTDTVVDVTAYGTLSASNFFARGILPAAIGLMAFGLALAVGMFVRSVVATLVVGILASGAVLVGAVLIQPHVLPPNRTVTEVADSYQPVTQAELDAQRSGAANDQASDADIDRNARYLGSGFLDANGRTVVLSNSQSQACYDQAVKAGDAAAAAAGLQPTSVDTGTAVVVDGSGAVAVQADSGYQDSAVYINAFNRAHLDCMDGYGITANYTDVLPGSRLWPLRWTIAGILLALAAGLTAVGAWRLRWAVAKR